MTSHKHSFKGHFLCKSLSRLKNKTLHYWSLCVGIHRWPVDSPHKGPVMRKCLLMTSSCFTGSNKKMLRHVCSQTGATLHEEPMHFPTSKEQVRCKIQRFVSDVIITAMAPQIISVPINFSAVLFRRWSKTPSKLRVTGFWEGNLPVTGEFPAQRASDAENVAITH